MKMDFRFNLFLLIALTLTACGKARNSSTVFESAKEECLADVVSKRYMVKYFDGRFETIQANSQEEFLEGFVSENLEKIEFAEPEYRVQRSAPAKEFAIAAQATVDNWGEQKVNVTSIWNQGFRGNGIAVAVIDSGMDLTHPQLAQQVFFNSGEKGLDQQGLDKASNGKDDDGNGLIDDYAGYDFAKNRPLQGDYQFHGSHVAGVIAAYHTDSQAGMSNHVQGLAPNAKILPLAFLDETGSGMMSDGVRAILYAAARGARVINASWGGTICSRSLRDAIASLDAQKIVFVAAAGNDASNIDQYREYPASFDFPAQITVGATGGHDYMASYSNYGEKSVHIFAPGSDIVSTIPGGIGALSGTSMAAPFVSGAVALLLSAEPTATPSQIRSALYNSSMKSSSYLNASRGRMNLTTALQQLRLIMATP